MSPDMRYEPRYELYEPRYELYEPRYELYEPGIFCESVLSFYCMQSDRT